MAARVVLGCLVMAVAFASPAHADPDSMAIATYLATLDKQHVSYGSSSRIVNVGTLACQQLHDGYSFGSIGEAIISGGFTAKEAGYIVGAAVMSFCPDMQPAMDRWEANNGR